MACLQYVPKEPIGYTKEYLEFSKSIVKLEDGTFQNLTTGAIYETLEEAEETLLSKGAFGYYRCRTVRM